MSSSRVTINKRFACDWPECGQAYVRRSILRNHITAKHRQLRHVCPLCRQDFCYKNDLRQHQKRIHEKQRPFVCGDRHRPPSGCACGKSFATTSELYRHKRANRPVSGHFRPARGVPGMARQAVVIQICRGPSLVGSLAELEQTIVALHGYVTGSFESGRWYVNNDGRGCSEMGNGSKSFGLHIMAMTVEVALCNKQYKMASLHLNRLCQAAQQATKVEDPQTLLNCVRLLLRVDGNTGIPHLEPTYRLLTEFLLALSIKVHGDKHPWTLVMRSFATSVTSGTAKDTLAVLAQALRAACAEAEGIDCPLTVYFELELLALADDPVQGLRNMLARLIEAHGESHPLVHDCIGRLLKMIWNQEGPAMVARELQSVALQMSVTQTSSSRNSWRAVRDWWRYVLAADSGDWHQASDIVAYDMIPTTGNRRRERHAIEDYYNVLLEEALEKSGQLDRLEQARARRASAMAQIAEDVALEDRLQEKAWLEREEARGDPVPEHAC